MMNNIRWILLTAVLTVSLFLASCAGAGARSILWYQEYPIAADIAVDGCSLALSKEGATSVFTVTSPEGLAGVRFEVKGDTVSVSYGETTVMLSPDAIENVRLMAGAFYLGQDRIKDVTDTQDGSVVTYAGDETDYVFTYDRDGNPLSFNYTLGSETKTSVIEKFSVDYGGNG